MDTHKDIELTFRYLPGEYLQALRAHQFARTFLAVDTGFSLLMLVCGLATFWWGGAFYRWLGLAFIGLGLLLPVLYALARLAARQKVANEAKFKQEYRLTFSERGIHFRTHGIDSHIDWSYYQSALRIGNFYLMYYSRDDFTVIPKRVLQETGTTEAFEEMLHRHVPKVELRS
ncbi:MAG: YcxB family protein [Bradyrhizobium sp.]|uniref:YcxB family protein n=1 Tax=Bradyrhizobium sp. TaxID=376 RepID=UPI0025BFE01F|nr:YcxB family protein [Bradyrhizobium sp.]MBI5263178.1 YcxB family protein [Bradyrhizobium sp.]